MKFLVMILLLSASAHYIYCMDSEDEADEFLQLAGEKLLETTEVEFVTAKFALEQLARSMEHLKLAKEVTSDGSVLVTPACFLKHEKQILEAHKIISVAWEAFEKDLSSESKKKAVVQESA